MMDLSTVELLEVGAVIGTHGLRGDLKIRTLPTGDLALQGAQQLYLKDGAGTLTRYSAVRISPHKKNYLVRLDGIAHINAASELVGRSVWMSRDEAPELPDDEHYWHELEGLEVFDQRLGFLGRVIGMFSTPAHDILEVQGDRGEILIPAIPQFIDLVSADEKRVLVNLPDGLVPESEEDSNGHPF